MKRKALGQHFLINQHAIDDEIEFAKLNSDDVVLEIGPGKGALTFPIAERVHKVYAIEKDKVLYDQLVSKVPDNVCLINADVLYYNLSKCTGLTKIVSNLPYKISSPLTFKLLSLPFQHAVLLYQKEFAERMVAKPGCKQYCRLSVGVYYYAQCQILREVSRHCFDPPPKVASCMVEIFPRQHPAFSVINEAFFFKITRELFNQRRKKIKTVIKNHYHLQLEDIPFADERVEQLNPEQIGSISDVVYRFIENDDKNTH